MSFERIFSLADDLAVPYEYSSKKYYNRYTFRLQFKVFEMIKEGAWGRHYKVDTRYHNLDYDEFHRKILEQRSASVEQFKSIRRALFNRSKGNGYTLRGSGWHGLNVYTENEHDVRMLLNNYSTEIKQLYAPMSETHVLIHNDRDKELRKNLYYNKYRYKLEYYGTIKFKESVESAAGCMPDDSTIKYSKNTSQCINESQQHVRSWNICSIYFEHETDWLTFKMMCDERPIRIVEAILFSEVDK